MKKFLFLLIILLSFNTVLSLDIYNCGILGKGNTIYVLKNNIFSSGKTCIEIVASNVTLDCQGHKIEGVGGPHSSYGIDIGTSNVSIKNCTITRWSMGIYFNGSSGSKIEGNQLENNIYGIHLMYSSSNTIEGNQLENNIYGIRLEDSSSNTIEGNQLENNNYGIRLEDSSSNTIEGNQLENNIYG
ncbi:MAG: right-handed parallel beta-helix repeat-containing protein, partial [Candidatus Aenigmarchaeota archaeon]|nr:right-handed parallel beta-helix repeat-containing protein [Candidatus Aenigmarchaeota archaeon]